MYKSPSTIVVILFTALFVFSCTQHTTIAEEPATEKSKPYNIVFIAVDDLNDWTGFLGGHPQTLTPNMDRLAAQGIKFERAYCPASVCNPSRAAIMSGFRPSTSGIYQNRDKVFDFPIIQQSPMMPQYFSEHGYHTMARGKIYHTPETGKHTWDEWSEVEGTYGSVQKNAGFMANGIPTGEMADNMDWGPTNATLEETPDFKNADWAAQQLKKDHDKPFFLACGIFRPHLKWQVPQEYFDKFDPTQMILPQVNESDLDDVGDRKTPTKEYTTIKKYNKEKEAVQAYLASINYADDCIGHLLDALENSAYKDNTIVVLWGDHGWHLGEKLRYKKFTLWDRACRTTLLMKVPGITTAGSSANQTVNLLDLYPTLLDLCGLPPNRKNQGHSIVPILKKTSINWPHASLTQMGEGQHSLRTERWRYLRYPNNAEELYDHVTDPQEWNNLASDSNYNGIKEQMKSKLNQILN